MIDTSKHAAIILHTEGRLKGLLEIRDQSICYSYDITTGYSGMQCDYAGGTPEYDEAMRHCERMRDNYLCFVQGHNILTENKIW